MSEIIFSVQESVDGGYEAQALGHSIFTQAESMAELREAVRDAVRCHFDEDKRPHVIRLHTVKDEGDPRLKLPRDLVASNSLHFSSDSGTKSSVKLAATCACGPLLRVKSITLPFLRMIH